MVTMKAWYHLNKIYLACILDNTNNDVLSLKIESKKGETMSDIEFDLTPGKFLYVTHIDSTSPPQYILISTNIDKTTHLIKPKMGPIPTVLIKLSGLHGNNDNNNIIHNLDDIYNSALSGVISQIVGMINSI